MCVYAGVYACIYMYLRASSENPMMLQTQEPLSICILPWRTINLSEPKAVIVTASIQRIPSSSRKVFATPNMRFCGNHFAAIICNLVCKHTALGVQVMKRHTRVQDVRNCDFLHKLTVDLGHQRLDLLLLILICETHFCTII